MNVVRLPAEQYEEENQEAFAPDLLEEASRLQSDLIISLGTKVVASECGVTPAAVSQWGKQRIGPWVATLRMKASAALSPAAQKTSRRFNFILCGIDGQIPIKKPVDKKRIMVGVLNALACADSAEIMRILAECFMTRVITEENCNSIIESADEAISAAEQLRENALCWITIIRQRKAPLSIGEAGILYRTDNAEIYI